MDRIRLPAERDLNEDPCWLRTCYDPSQKARGPGFKITSIPRSVGPATVFNDSSLYNFGSNWENIFLRAPQLLDNTCLFEEYEENVQEALEEAIESDETDPQRAEERAMTQRKMATLGFAFIRITSSVSGGTHLHR